MFFGQQLGTRFAKAHRTAFTATLHAVHKINPDPYQKQEWQEADDKRLENRCFLTAG